VKNRKLFKPTLLASTLASTFLAQPAAVLAVQVGPQFVVASSSIPAPPVVASSSAGFVVGWATQSHTDSTGIVQPGAAYIKTFASDGAPLSAEITLGPTGSRIVPSNSPGVAIDADGDVVAAWNQSPSTAAYLTSGTLYAKRYSSTGVSKGNAIRVGGTLDYTLPLVIVFPTLTTTGARVAMDDAGDFVVAWGEDGYAASYCVIPRGCRTVDQYSKTYAASYRADGVAYKWKTQIDRVGQSAKLPNSDELDGIALLNNGNSEFLFTGAQRGVAMSPSLKTFSKSLLQSGTPASLDIAARPGASARFDATGNVYVLWNDAGKCHVSHFSPSGDPLGQDAVVNSGGYFCSLAVAPSGAFAVTWTVPGTEGDINGQYFNADGSSNGTAFVIEPSASAVGSYFASALDANGHLVVTWVKSDQSSAESVVGRVVSGP
jgi:hypothetical protein